MDYTTLPLGTRAVTDPETVPVSSLYQALQKLSDPRRAQGKRYELALILCLLVLAKLAGQKTLSGATEWIRHRSSALAQRFGLRREKMPCQMTYCNVLAMVDAKQLDEILAAFFVRWEAASAGVERNPAACTPRKATPIMPIWRLMAKRFVRPPGKHIRFINSVVMKWPQALFCGTAMCKKNRMRSVPSNLC